MLSILRGEFINFEENVDYIYFFCEVLFIYCLYLYVYLYIIYILFRLLIKI